MVVTLVLVLALIGGGSIFGYYYYQNANYVTTEDARVAADTVTITPQIPGKLITWKVEEGDFVKADQVMGRQDVEASLTSSTINSQVMSASAGIMAQKAAIRSPISGQVIQSKAVLGQMAAPGMTLAVVADVKNSYISANIKETVINRVKIGQVVDVEIDAFPDRVFSGRVESLGKATTSVFSLLPTQNANGNFTKVTQVIPVKIKLLDEDLDLSPGMSATVRIHIK
ncbi:MAG: hypothetical protein PWP31_1450 [Clostridia bacterium]|nr:hypothetical protein [Clostridia bacterium]